MLVNGEISACSELLRQYTTSADILDSMLKVDKVLTDTEVIDEYATSESIVMKGKAGTDPVKQYNKIKAQMIEMTRR